MLLIRRIDNFTYSFALSDKKSIKLICKILTFPNPDPYAYSNDIIMFNRDHLTFKIGMITNVIRYLKEESYEYVLEDYVFNSVILQPDIKLTGKYSYQFEAVESFFNKRFGIIEVPTRGGKTFILSEIIRNYLKFYKGNMLIIVDSVDLFRQIRDDIMNYFVDYNGIEIGRINSDIFEIERITVGMIQTIQSTLSTRCKDRKKKNKLDSYLKSLDFLAIDEIHDNFSTKRQRIYNKSKKINFLLCLSATPYKEESFIQNNLRLQAWSGGIIYTIKENSLIEREVLTKYKVYFLYNEVEELKNSNYQDIKKEVFIENDNRNKKIIDLINFVRNEKIKTLVLFQMIEHGNNISEQTGITFLSGVDKIDRRFSEKQDFLKKDGGVLLASNIFKKGITLPEVELLINVNGGLESSTTIQKKGRVLGFLQNKKKSLIIDFFDDCEYFDEHSCNRYNTYVNQIGENNVFIFNSETKSDLDEIKNSILRWLKR